MTLKIFLPINIMIFTFRHNDEIPNKNKSLPLFHVNSCSLNKNVDNL